MTDIRMIAIAGSALTCLALVGCTAPQGPAPDLTPSPSESASAPDGDRILDLQSQAVVDNDPEAELLSTETGTGESQWVLPPLPAGKTQYGAVVNCTGTGGFEVTFDQPTPSHFESTCSTVDLISGSYPVDDIAKEVPAHLDIEPGTDFWVTFYAI